MGRYPEVRESQSVGRVVRRQRTPSSKEQTPPSSFRGWEENGEEGWLTPAVLAEDDFVVLPYTKRRVSLDVRQVAVDNDNRGARREVKPDVALAAGPSQPGSVSEPTCPREPPNPRNPSHHSNRASPVWPCNPSNPISPSDPSCRPPHRASAAIQDARYLLASSQARGEVTKRRLSLTAGYPCGTETSSSATALQSPRTVSQQGKQGTRSNAVGQQGGSAATQHPEKLEPPQYGSQPQHQHQHAQHQLQPQQQQSPHALQTANHKQYGSSQPCQPRQVPADTEPSPLHLSPPSRHAATQQSLAAANTESKHLVGAVGGQAYASPVTSVPSKEPATPEQAPNPAAAPAPAAAVPEPAAELKAYDNMVAAPVLANPLDQTLDPHSPNPSWPPCEVLLEDPQLPPTSLTLLKVSESET